MRVVRAVLSRGPPREACATLSALSARSTIFRSKHRRLACAGAVMPCCMLNHMVQYGPAHFDSSFGALSDATRRGVLEQLGRADASITALAEKFHMTLTGMKKHVGVLEHAGLVTTEKVGRVRTCKLGRRGLQEEAAWIESYRQLWSARCDELDKVVEELKGKEKADGRKKRK
jgi:DNA-binding transcriptional ArsR family regulator